MMEGWPTPGRLTGLVGGVLLLVAGLHWLLSDLKLPATHTLVPVAWSAVGPEWSEGTDLKAWAEALQASAGYYRRLPPKRTLDFGGRAVTAAAMVAACQDLAVKAEAGDAQALAAHLASGYQLYRSVGSDQRGRVLVTGYYEPLLLGTSQPGNGFTHPLYRRPDDLMEIKLEAWSGRTWPVKRLMGRLEGRTLLPYYDRRQIDGEGKLNGKGWELAWVDDPIDLFFLHIQGSGRLLMADGTMMRVGFDADNGHAYRSIGGILIQEGRMNKEEMSLFSLRRWLRDNPRLRDRILYANPSYVFFRKIEGGPYGNINVALTPGHSIATDAQVFPKGAPAIVVTQLPVFAPKEEKPSVWRSLTRLVVNQDTGGAIKGAGRVDLFTGFGSDAERTAGNMKQDHGALYFIAPR